MGGGGRWEVVGGRWEVVGSWLGWGCRYRIRWEYLSVISLRQVEIGG